MKIYIWFDIIRLLSVFNFCGLRPQLFKTNVDNYFWGLSFSLSSFSHHKELVVKHSHFSNLVMRPHEKQATHLKMYLYDAILIADPLQYNFWVTISLLFKVIFFFSSVVKKLFLKRGHVSLPSHSFQNKFCFYKAHHCHYLKPPSNSLFAFTGIS